MARNKTALIVGAQGQLGTAIAGALLGDGWQVRGLSLSSPPVRPCRTTAWTGLIGDRNEVEVMDGAVGAGVDVIIDVTAYGAEHAKQLLRYRELVGALTVISTVAVYCDENGQTIDQANGPSPPRFPSPLHESSPIISPNDRSYSGRKAGLEACLQENWSGDLMIIRPGAVYGPRTRSGREWWFIKRVLDGRPVIPLAYAGESRFHQASALNVAQLLLCALNSSFCGVLNAVDDRALSALEIGREIVALYKGDAILLPFDGPPLGVVGDHPWCIDGEMVVSMRAAEGLGYLPVTSYLQSLPETCAAAESLGRSARPVPAYLAASAFDYIAEDAFLKGLAGVSGPDRSPS